jgi:hypothetical protein
MAYTFLPSDRVGFHQHRPGQPQQRRRVVGRPDNVGAAFDLSIWNGAVRWAAAGERRPRAGCGSVTADTAVRTPGHSSASTAGTGHRHGRLVGRRRTWP